MNGLGGLVCLQGGTESYSFPTGWRNTPTDLDLLGLPTDEMHTHSKPSMHALLVEVWKKERKTKEGDGYLRSEPFLPFLQQSH